MRRWMILTGAGAAALMFMASPFHAAWEIRQAIRSGDKTTLERRVDWPSVRTSLHRTYGATQQVLTEITEAGGAPKPSLWWRIVSSTVPMLSGTAIDYYVTPDGVPQLYAWRETWRQKIRPAIGLSEPPMLLAGTMFEGTAFDKMLSAMRRIDRAAFVSPGRVELQIRDRYAAHRSYRAVMELKGLTWMLTEVQVLTVEQPPASQPGAPASS